MYADFSGEDILVAFFQLQRHLKVIRVTLEEIKTGTTFVVKWIL